MRNKILFFGDSLTSAENNNYKGFVEKLSFSNYINYGVSGTTFGNYSLYPVKDNDLLSLLYKHTNKLKSAKIIILEYGINDTSAIFANYTSLSTAIISFVKCVDYIKQVSSAKIYFIELGCNVDLFAKSQTNYLLNNYLSVVPITPCSSWKSIYNSLINIVKEILPSIKLTLSPLTKDHIDTDEIHPNDIGYNIIAEDIKKQLKF